MFIRNCMKVLLVNWVYAWGSTGYIARDIKAELEAQGHEVKVAAAVNRGDYDPEVFLFNNERVRLFYWRLSRLGWPMYQGSSQASKKLINYIKKEKFDIVHLHVLNGSCLNLYKLLDYLSANNIRTVITHHAEFYYTGSCGYAYNCTKFIDEKCKGCPNKNAATSSYAFSNPHSNWVKMYESFSHFKKENIIFTSVSPWVNSRMELSPIMKGFEGRVVMNGVDTSIFRRRKMTDDDCKELAEDYMLYVSANFNPLNKNDVKGGCYLVELAKQMPEHKFIVVATNILNADYLPENIIIWGKAKNQMELARLYSNAKLTVLTSLRETFSMICAESLCCGTPVVGFEAGGPESISIKEYSQFVKFGDIDALRNAVNRHLEISYDRDEIAIKSMQVFSKKCMTEGYIKVYKELLNKE